MSYYHRGTDLRLDDPDADVAAGIGRNPAAPSKVVGEQP